MTDWVNQEDRPVRQLSLSDFKKWMNHQLEDEDQIQEDITGSTVECSVSLKKLVSKMETEDGEVNELAKDFKRNGGTVISTDGDVVLLEVESGSFYIKRNYVSQDQD